MKRLFLLAIFLLFSGQSHAGAVAWCGKALLGAALKQTATPVEYHWGHASQKGDAPFAYDLFTLSHPELAQISGILHLDDSDYTYIRHDQWPELQKRLLEQRRSALRMQDLRAAGGGSLIDRILDDAENDLLQPRWKDRFQHFASKVPGASRVRRQVDRTYRNYQFHKAQAGYYARIPTWYLDYILGSDGFNSGTELKNMHSILRTLQLKKVPLRANISQLESVASLNLLPRHTMLLDIFFKTGGRLRFDALPKSPKGVIPDAFKVQKQLLDASFRRDSGQFNTFLDTIELNLFPNAPLERFSEWKKDTEDALLHELTHAMVWRAGINYHNFLEIGLRVALRNPPPEADEQTTIRGLHFEVARFFVSMIASRVKYFPADFIVEDFLRSYETVFGASSTSEWLGDLKSVVEELQTLTDPTEEQGDRIMRRLIKGKCMEETKRSLFANHAGRAASIVSAYYVAGQLSDAFNEAIAHAAENAELNFKTYGIDPGLENAVKAIMKQRDSYLLRPEIYHLFLEDLP